MNALPLLSPAGGTQSAVSPSPSRDEGALWRGARGEGIVHDERGHSFSTLRCASFALRLRGWLFRAPTIDAILLTPCQGVHFWGARVTLDVLFLDAFGNVGVHARRRPWGAPLWVPRAWGVLEVVSDRVPLDWHPRRVAWQERD